jgi:2-C-methyl-D-erythritol 4-phosphate cytidylyltransferase
VERTLDRSVLWEMHTPQVVRPQLLRDGFALVARDNLAVTDDVSIVEAMGLPVFITQGEYTNLKVTTPEDMFIAERLMDEAQAASRK